jgi:hypothetical protein
LKASAAKVNGTLHPEPPRRSARLKSPSPPRTNGIHKATTDEQGNEVPTGGDEPSPKKQRKAPPPTVEDIPDVDMHSPTSPTSTTPSGDVFDTPESQHNAKKTTPVMNGNLFSGTAKAPFPLKSSAPKEPSKLRFGFAAESDPDSPPPPKSTSDTPGHVPDQPHAAVSLSSAPKPPGIPSLPTPSAAPSMAAKTSLPEAGPSTESRPTMSVPQDPKQEALLLDPASLPSFSFNVPTGLQPPSKQAKEHTAASVVDPSSLPTFTFALGAKPVPVGFNWEAAGAKYPVKAAGSWTCGTCMVFNDANKFKCVSCEEPRPDSVTKGTSTVPAAVPELPKPVAPTGGFNWAAAGLKMPTKAPGTWTCNVCMVDNESAKTKCVSCEEPRPKPAIPSSGSFNWAAAGLKMPTKPPGAWTCKVCMVDNDATKTKCISCEEPRA